MSTKRVRILVKGVSWSGSGALVDLLKEYSSVVQIPGGLEKWDYTGESRYGEFNFFRDFGGIGDQIEYDPEVSHPSILKSELKALKRSTSTKSLTYQYLKSIILRNEKYKRSGKDIVDALRKIGNSFEDLIAEFDEHEEREYRLQKTKEWILRIEEDICAKHHKFILFDQAVNFGQHEALWTEVFDPYKLIVVVRNPKDQFSQMANNRNYFSRHFMQPQAYYMQGWSMKDAIQYRIDSKRNELACIEKYISGHKDHSLLLTFEELILRYDETKDKIQRFLGLNEADHVFKKRYFDPSISRKNLDLAGRSPIKVSDASLMELYAWYNKNSSYFKVDESGRLISEENRNAR